MWDVCKCVIFVISLSLTHQYSLCEDKINLLNLIHAYQALYKGAGSFNSNDTSESEDVFATTTDFVKKHGYPVETHTVTTEDGFILTVHRIPGSPKAPVGGVKTPVFLQHGIFSASDNWVLMGPEKSLGYLLADLGYDVWIGNARGNYYSRKHQSLDPKSPKFWDFSWHEMGFYDLPAVIDHILKTTGQPKLIYVGHSMGTTMFFVMASSRPEYNEKIKLMVALSPVVYNKDFRQKTLKALTSQTPMLYWSMKTTGLKITELFPRHKNYINLIDMSCTRGKITQAVCIKIYFSIIGANIGELNVTMLPVMLSHVISGSSLGTVLHYAEIFRADRFQAFDRSVKKEAVMPEYDLSKVTAPVSLHYAVNDIIIHPDGVMKLSKALPNVVNMVKLPNEKATHTDFLFANSVKTLVNDDVISIMKKY